LFSAPGRTEIGGNHTDHQHGRVLAAAVDLDILAAAAPNQSGMIRVQSQGYPLMVVDLAALTPQPSEENTSAALIRGVAARLSALGCPLQGVGLDVYMTSSVPGGSGLSSSAAFEVLIGTMLNGLFFGGKCTPLELAQIGQYAENVFFGKPCGLMDQTASSVGGVVAIDFADTEHPVVEQISLDLTAHGYALCILDSGAGHADLTGEYAAITDDLKTVCRYFGKEVLREVPEADFLAALPQVRRSAGDRAVLRAMHVYAENRRAADEAQSLREGDFDRFLSLVRRSGESSALYLQNVVPTGQTANQELMVTIALCETILAGRGAVRVHGGGFGGTAQAFVPLDLLDTFKAKTEAVLGQDSCHVVTIRPVGGVQIV
jgi:galactokinase